MKQLKKERGKKTLPAPVRRHQMLPTMKTFLPRRRVIRKMIIVMVEAMIYDQYCPSKRLLLRGNHLLMLASHIPRPRT